MVQLNFQLHYSSLQCHMILQKFDAEEIFIIIINVENKYIYIFFLEIIYFLRFLEYKVQQNRIYIKSYF